jgi:hypothetical protein
MNRGVWHKWWPWGTSRATRNDFDNDGKSDIALVASAGGPTWDHVRIGFSSGNQTFGSTGIALVNFPTWARATGAKPVAGDFNGDGRDDIALTGGQSWDAVPVALSKGNGGFTELSYALQLFPVHAQQTGAKPVAGDFNGDGRDDIAIIGALEVTAIPVAFSKGDGTFEETQTASTTFQDLAKVSGAKPVPGDFNRDGKTDIALTGGQGWTTIHVGLSNGDGTFTVPTTPTVTGFPTWALASGAKAVAGDFDGNGDGDIALVGGQGWDAVPVALSNGDGTFTPLSNALANFPTWATLAGAKPVIGNFDEDAFDDIALVGVQGWAGVPIASSKGNGTFEVVDPPATGELPGFAALAGVTPLSGQ